MHEIDWTIERGNATYKLKVLYKVAKLYPAVTSGGPDDWAPAEGGEITELYAYSKDDQLFELTSKEESKLEKYIYDHHDYYPDE